MKKLFFDVIFLGILIFSFSLKVNADCSYNERTQLLNEANNVDIFFEPAEKIETVTAINPNSGESYTIQEKTLYLKMNFSNISDNIFLKVVNKSNNDSFIVRSKSLVNGIYSVDMMDVESIISYSVTFYSNNDNCYANKINSTTYKKPRINLVSQYDVCQNELVADSKYCKRFIDTEFSMSEVEIVEYLNNKIEEARISNEEPMNEKPFVDILKKYWYVPIILLALIAVGSVTFIVIKKRGELK